ncbi:MAG: DUF6636 domain-containing protein [Paracoccus sp. (in: a-proteobacteria)]
MLRIVMICLLAALPASADVFGFETPSGNIDCSVGIGEGSSDIRCIIHQKDGAAPQPKPAGCTAGWGHVFSMQNRGPAVMECAGPGRNTGAFETADYGVTSADWDGIRCKSSRQGLECWNADGHGFFLSRREQRLY